MIPDAGPWAPPPAREQFIFAGITGQFVFVLHSRRRRKRRNLSKNVSFLLESCGRSPVPMEADSCIASEGKNLINGAILSPEQDPPRLCQTIPIYFLFRRAPCPDQNTRNNITFHWLHKFKFMIMVNSVLPAARTHPPLLSKFRPLLRKTRVVGPARSSIICVL